MFSFNLVKEFAVEDTEMIYDSNFHPSRDNIFALSTIEGDVFLMDLNAQNNNCILKLKRHHKGSSVRRVRFANDNLLVSAAKTIKLFDMDTGKVLRKINNDNAMIYSLLILDNYLLCIGDDEGNFKAWDYRVDRGVFAHLKECEEYISDLDADAGRRIVVAASGEGTLSAFNVRAKRLEPPQSELFDAGFQSVRYLHDKDKVIVGAEDGAINIFNQNEWGNISARFPIRGSGTRSQGICSVDNIEVLSENVVAVGTSEGKMLAVSILPNKILTKICSHKTGVESISVNSKSRTVLSTNDNLIKIHKFDQCEEATKRNEFFSELDTAN